MLVALTEKFPVRRQDIRDKDGQEKNLTPKLDLGLCTDALF